jgi:tellurite resistance protein
MELLPVTDCSLASLESALAQLAAAPPTTKREVLSACAATAAADGQLSPREAELLRAIAAALDCPVPPLAG